MTLLLTILGAGVLVAFAPKIIAIILSMLPTSEGLPVEVFNAITFGIEKINAFSFIFPISDMVRIVQLIVIFEVAMLTLKLTMKIIHFVRGTS